MSTVNINTLRELAGTDDTVGNLIISEKTNQLETSETHKYFKILNKPPKSLTNDFNRSARLEVFESLKNALIERHDKAQLLADQKAFLRRAAIKLGIPIDNKEVN